MTWLNFKEEQTDAPNRSARKQCWESRDLFFACLDKSKIENSLAPGADKQVASACAKPLKAFERDCASSWVKYFQEKRYVDIKKERMIQDMKSKGIEVPFGK
ncbi:hypothetical protein BABINDRAFT_58475 [Babjeviella inositovora NRRL Y-12698]|uniref:Cytochrome c oxidase assembly factor 6 n=1 Tax=Babjeviella inositovora NRRL Y-12698 TaxID=984486 RepID=A0A1E3QW26_9ASCO|nr:uncharacterized protein BABINDRAFT_58475 [Babjeviella inositovora NRRL Y-12698]ODQ81794.1 hypothetical protein BABINDRAFT_58475 [Babjeviella inositovora NRRL Y-12698]